MSGRFKRLLAFYRRFDSKNVFFPNYIFNKWLFLGWFVLLLLFLVVFAVVLGSNNYEYVRCPTSQAYCLNPLFDESCVVGTCSVSLLNGGESLGTKPPFVVDYFFWLVLLSGGVVFGLNHWLFNSKGNKGVVVRLKR